MNVHFWNYQSIFKLTQSTVHFNVDLAENNASLHPKLYLSISKFVSYIPRHLQQQSNRSLQLLFFSLLLSFFRSKYVFYAAFGG